MPFRQSGLLLLLAFASLQAGTPGTSLSKSFGNLPLAFEDRNGSYASRGTGYSLLLTPSATVFNLRGSIVTLRMIGANRYIAMTGIDRLTGTANYFQGKNSRESFTLYSDVRAKNVYPGIDIVFHGSEQHPEYDFNIASRRDPGVISLAFSGAESIRIDQHGDLIVSTAGGEIRQPRPVAWQIQEGRKEFISVSWSLDAARHATFLIGPHDENEPLTIDPEVVFDNVFGGSGTTSAVAIGLDAQGNIYAAGNTQSLDFPVAYALQSKNLNGGQTAFLAKWSPDGSQLLYSTYLGGSVYDAATSLAVDSSGNAYIAGVTSSADFPVTAGAFQRNLVGASNAFVAKLSPTGSHLIYSTFLGGGSEQAAGIAVDSGGNAVVTGETDSSGFPVTPNAFQSAPVGACPQGGLTVVGLPATGDAFVTRFAPDAGSLLFSTLLGGTCGTIGQAIAIDASGNAWIGGETGSPDFPVTGNALQPKFGGGQVDGFLAKFTASGMLDYASYLGGPGYDIITGIALDGDGNIDVAGVSGGLSQPASPGAVESAVGLNCIQLGMGPLEVIDNGDAFAARLTPNAGSVSALTYLGFGCILRAVVAVDSSGAVWVAGSSFAGNPFPTVSPFQIGIGGGYVSKLSADFTQLLFSTDFNSVGGITLDSSGHAYVAGAGAYVAEIDPAASAVSLDQVLPAGGTNTYTPMVTPGEVVRLIGKNLGPATFTSGVVNSSDFVTTSVAGVQVNFTSVAGTVPAPLLSVSAGEIDCVVPFEAGAGQTTTATSQATISIQVQYNGVSSNSVLMPVAALAVELLAVLNEDFTFNSASNPARAGSIIEVYISGAGQTVPPGLDGQVIQPPFAAAAAQIQVLEQVNPEGAILPVTYAGAAPGLVSGILQINFVAPPTSAQVEVVSRLNTSVSAVTFNVAIQ